MPTPPAAVDLAPSRARAGPEPEAHRPGDAALFARPGARHPLPVATSNEDDGETALPESMPPEQAIWQTLENNKHGLGECVADAWRRGERLRGTMETEITINPKGRTVGARVLTAGFRPSLLATCALSRIRGWRFPRWPGKTPLTVVLPYLIDSEP